MGYLPRQVKPRTITLLFAASPLSTQFYRERADMLTRNENNVLVERHVYQRTVVSVSLHYNDPIKCVGKVQSG
jgi:hypothetical protein